MQLNNGDGAREAFLQVLGEKRLDAELDDVSERAVLGWAELAFKQGDALNCKKLALRIVTERPESAWTDSALFLAGQASESLGEPERAIAYYRKMLTDKPTSTHATAAAERLKALGAPQKQ